MINNNLFVIPAISETENPPSVHNTEFSKKLNEKFMECVLPHLKKGGEYTDFLIFISKDGTHQLVLKSTNEVLFTLKPVDENSVKGSRYFQKGKGKMNWLKEHIFSVMIGALLMFVLIWAVVVYPKCSEEKPAPATETPAE